MEPGQLPVLLEEVLSGRPEDPQRFKESTDKLHILLKSSSQSIIHSATTVSSSMVSSKRLSKFDCSLFTNYLSKIKQSNHLPSFSHLQKINSGLKVAGLFHALHKVDTKYQLSKLSAFLAIKKQPNGSCKDLELKRLQCARLIGNIKANLGITLEKTMSCWNLNSVISAPRFNKNKNLAFFQKREKNLALIKNLILRSPAAFEQQAFWKWKLVKQMWNQLKERLETGIQTSDQLRLKYLKKLSYVRLKENSVPLWKRKRKLVWSVLRKSEIRLFFAKLVAFKELSYGNMYEEYEEEEEEHRQQIIKIVKKRCGYENGEISSEKLKELVNKMMERQLVRVESQEKIPILIKNLTRIKNKQNFTRLVRYLKKIAEAKKNIRNILLSIWKGKTGSKDFKVFKGIALLKNLLRKSFVKIIYSQPDDLVSIEERTYIQEVIEYKTIKQNPGYFKALADNSIVYSNTAQVALLRWKNKKLAKQLEILPKDYTRTCISLIFKIVNKRIGQVFKTWLVKTGSKVQEDKAFKIEELVKTGSKIQENKAFKIEELVKTLNKALAKNTKLVYKMPKALKQRNEILSNAILAICKNLLYVKTRAFKKLLESSNRKNAKEKIEEYMLRNLAKYPKMVLIQCFSRWRQLKANNSRQLFSMISVLNRIFSSKGKRVFNPPRVIKDADQIMRRCIRKLTHVKDWALRVGIMRWKYFKLIQKGRKKTISVIKVLHMMSNPSRIYFFNWKENAKTKKYVFKANATGKVVQSINKIFRSYWKMFLFKSMFSRKNKTLLKQISRFYNRLYSENIRLSYHRWKDYNKKSDLKFYENKKSSLVIHLVYRLNRRLSSSYSAWKDYKEQCDKQYLLDNFRTTKLVSLLSKPIRTKYQQIVSSLKPDDRASNIINKLFTSFQYKLRETFFSWKFIWNLHKKNEVLNKSARLKEILKTLAGNGLKSASEKIFSHGNQVKFRLPLLIEKLKFRPKNAINKWKNYANQIRHKKILTLFRASLVNKILTRVLAKQLQDTRLRIAGTSITERAKRLAKALDLVLRKKLRTSCDRFLRENEKARVFGKIIHLAARRPRSAILKWIKFAERQLLSDFKCEKMLNLLSQVPRKAVKDAFNRIIGGIEGTKGLVLRAFGRILGRPKIAVAKWVKYSAEIDKKKLLDSLRSRVLKNAIQGVAKRILRDAKQRISGNGEGAKALILRALGRMEKRPKIAVAKWVKYSAEVDKKKLLDSLRNRVLNNTIQGVAKRILRDAKQRISGNGEGTKALILRALGRMEKKPKIAVAKWVKYSAEVDKKKLLDNARSQKLKNALFKVPLRTIKTSFQRITGNKIKDVLNNIVRKLKQRPKEPYYVWKDYIRLCKTKSILDILRSQKLKSSLIKILQRSVKDSFQRIIGSGDKAKGLLDSLYCVIEKLPKRAFITWKDFMKDTKAKRLLTSLLSSQLVNALALVPTRSLRSVFKILVPDYIKEKSSSKFKALVIKDSLSKPARRVLRSTKSHVDHDDSKLKLGLKVLSQNIIKLNSDAFRKWLVKIRAGSGRNIQKLPLNLSKVLLPQLRRSFNLLLGRNFKLFSALRSLVFIVKQRPKLAFIKWFKCIALRKMNQLIDNLNLEKLLKAFNRVPKRLIKDAFNKVVRDERAAKALISRALGKVLRKPKTAVIKWVNYSAQVDRKILIENLRSQKLINSMQGVAKKALRDAAQRIFNKRKPAESLISIVLRRVLKRPKMAVGKWVKYSSEIDKKILLNNLLSSQLKSSFSLIPTRSLRTVFNSLLPDDLKEKTRAKLKALAIKDSLSNPARRVLRSAKSKVDHEDTKLRLAFKVISETCQKVNRDSFKKWCLSTNPSKLILQNKGQLLKSKLSPIINKTLKQSLMQIKSDLTRAGDKLSILSLISKNTARNSFNTWQTVCQLKEKKELVDAKRFYQLLNIVKRVSSRTLLSVTAKFSNEKLSILKQAVRVLIRASRKTQNDSFEQWKSSVVSFREQELMNKYRGAKLQIKIASCSQAGVRKYFTRVSGGSLVRGVLSRMISKWENLLKSSFRTFYNCSKTRTIIKVYQTIKIQRFSNNILNKRLRQAFDLFFFDGRVLRLLRRLFENFEDMQKKAFSELWNRVQKWRTIKKINSAYFVFRSLLSYTKKVKIVRFGFWKNLEELRRLRIKKKTVGKMLSFTSINYESALWRWKTIVTNTSFHVTPKHSLALKRFILSGVNYQKRLVQSGFYRVSLYHRGMLSSGKLGLSQAISHIRKHSRGSSRDLSTENILSSLLEPINKSTENRSLSTAASNKLSKDEANSINQLGCFEIIYVLLGSAKARKTSWALASIFMYSKQVNFHDRERVRLIQQINELRFEKTSLLEDNNTLRMHNDTLIENLEQSNLEFQNLSLTLDTMRILRMVRVISKMIEIPVAKSFKTIHDHHLSIIV